MIFRPALPCVLALLVAGCTVDEASRPGPRVEPPQAAATPSGVAASPRTREVWISEVDDICSYGRAMYPSVSLGMGADVDAVEYGMNAFFTSLTALEPPAEPAVRAAGNRLVETAGEVAAQWKALATAPSVTSAQRRAGVARARAVLLQAADLGATTCRRLAPRAGPR